MKVAIWYAEFRIEIFYLSLHISKKWILHPWLETTWITSRPLDIPIWIYITKKILIMKAALKHVEFRIDILIHPSHFGTKCLSQPWLETTRTMPIGYINMNIHNNENILRYINSPDRLPFTFTKPETIYRFWYLRMPTWYKRNPWHQVQCSILREGPMTETYLGCVKWPMCW